MTTDAQDKQLAAHYQRQQAQLDNLAAQAADATKRLAQVEQRSERGFMRRMAEIGPDPGLRETARKRLREV